MRSMHSFNENTKYVYAMDIHIVKCDNIKLLICTLLLTPLAMENYTLVSVLLLT